MNDYKVKRKTDKIKAKLFGFSGELYAKIIEKRLTSDFAVENILAEAEEPFFSKSDDTPGPVGWWRGEFWGKWIIGAVRACKYEKNSKLEEIIRISVNKIISTADENGYIGTYRDASFISLLLPGNKERAPVPSGFIRDFCWNIWCQKYTIWGLVEAYELLEDKCILNAASDAANQLIDVIHDFGINPCEAGTFFGVASGSIMKPILLLYRHTNEKKLFDFAIEIANGFEDDKAKCIKIIKKSLKKIPIHIWNYDNPDAKGAERFASLKAYEMMSCFEGILELYRVTGENKYLMAATNFFDLTIEYEYNRLFSVGFNDRFTFAASVEDAASEPCDIIHFMRLCADLYLLTGNIKYIDFYESAFLNPFLASITADGSWGARAVRSISHHAVENNVIGMKYNHCCVNNMPRAFENAANMIMGKQSDGIVINMYIPSYAGFDCGHIEISEGYMRDCKCEIRYFMKKDTLIKLRIPEWSKNSKIIHNLAAYTPKAASYCEIFVPGGCGVINMEFDSTPNVMTAGYERDLFPITAHLKKRYDLGMPAECVKANKATVRVGPMLLAMSVKFGTDFEQMNSAETVNEDFVFCSAKSIECEGTLAAYEMTFETKSGSKTFPMCDYASASSGFLPRSFSIFI